MSQPKSIHSKRLPGGLLVAVILLSMLWMLTYRGAGRPRQHITIAGHYSNGIRDRENNTFTNAFDAYFVAQICGEQWQIDVSRSRDIFEGTEDYPERIKFATNQWERISFDGTNTYYTSTYPDHFNVAMTGPHDLFTDIFATAGLSDGGQSRLGLYSAWLAYGLEPQKIARIPGHTIPLPWRGCTVSLEGFGYRWEVQPADGAGFAQTIKMVRDRKLDLAEEAEFLRPEHRYPTEPETKKFEQATLQVRKSVPDGLAVGEYVCKGHLTTNGVSVPTEAMFTRYTPSKGLTNRLAIIRSTLEAEWVKVEPYTNLTFHAPAGADVRVLDYRYHLVNSQIAKNLADYTITDGSDYKGTNDASLWQQVNGQ